VQSRCDLRIFSKRCFTAPEARGACVRPQTLSAAELFTRTPTFATFMLATFGSELAELLAVGVR
jgi:hypothetical protein